MSAQQSSAFVSKSNVNHLTALAVLWLLLSSRPAQAEAATTLSPTSGGTVDYICLSPLWTKTVGTHAQKNCPEHYHDDGM